MTSAATQAKNLDLIFGAVADATRRSMLDRLRGGSLTVTEPEKVEVRPSVSVTVRVTLYVPPAAYVCVGLTSLDELPSPNCQAC